MKTKYDLITKILTKLTTGVRFGGFKHGPQQMQAEDAVAVTPDDTDTIAITSGLYVGSDGNVNVTMASGNDVIFTGVLAGSILPIRVIKVLSTSTTATNIIALY
jgi:hypothetical protein